MAIARKKRTTTRSAAKASTAHPGFLTVGQTARILGVSPSTVRLWESVGLITPARNGLRRLYGPELLDLLKRIKYLRETKKLNVAGIKQALGNNPSRTSAANGTSPSDIGRKLRKLRTQMGFTISEAATRAKISTGFLSAVELSRANASVATLQRLAATYDTTVLELFNLPRNSRTLLRPQDRRAVQTETGVRMEFLSTGCKMLESMLFRVPPGTGSDGAYSHEGEEFIYMLEGTLEIWLDEIEFQVLKKGDSFWFESSRGHRWMNPGSRDAVLLWINTPPTF